MSFQSAIRTKIFVSFPVYSFSLVGPFASAEQARSPLFVTSGWYGLYIVQKV